MFISFAIFDSVCVPLSVCIHQCVLARRLRTCPSVFIAVSLCVRPPARTYSSALHTLMRTPVGDDMPGDVVRSGLCFMEHTVLSCAAAVKVL